MSSNKIITVKSPSGNILLALPDGHGGITYRNLDGSEFTGACGGMELYCCEGKSAYEVAVENGFSGTEEEWLESLIGDPGETGPKGDNGSVWITGTGVPNNNIGVDGDLYLDNDTGDVYIKTSGVWTLETNIKGPQGIPGPQGAGISFQGTAESEGELPSNGNNINDAYTVNGELFIWDGSEWISAGSVVGPPGEPGTPGTPGSPGSPGANGQDGATWSLGSGVPSNGNGNNGDFYLDTTTWNVYNKVEGSWVLVGSIKGVDGADGADGANGKSAYEIALDNGFSGNQVEWLESLEASCDCPEPTEPCPQVYIWADDEGFVVTEPAGISGDLSIEYYDNAKGLWVDKTSDPCEDLGTGEEGPFRYKYEGDGGCTYYSNFFNITCPIQQ